MVEPKGPKTKRRKPRRPLDLVEEWLLRWNFEIVRVGSSIKAAYISEGEQDPVEISIIWNEEYGVLHMNHPMRCLVTPKSRPEILKLCDTFSYRSVLAKVGLAELPGGPTEVFIFSTLPYPAVTEYWLGWAIMEIQQIYVQTRNIFRSTAVFEISADQAVAASGKVALS